MASKGSVIPAAKVPTHYWLSSSRLKKRRRAGRPDWIDDPIQVARVHGVYDMYLKRHTLPEIEAKFGISVTQIYRDIDHAKDEARIRLQRELEEMTFNQIEVRRANISEMHAEIQALRENEQATPARARAISGLMQEINRQEQAVEELAQIRVRGGSIDPRLLPPSEEQPNQGRIAVFDVQTMNIYPSGVPSASLPAPDAGAIDADYTSSEEAE